MVPGPWFAGPWFPGPWSLSPWSLVRSLVSGVWFLVPNSVSRCTHTCDMFRALDTWLNTGQQCISKERNEGLLCSEAAQFYCSISYSFVNTEWKAILKARNDLLSLVQLSNLLPRTYSSRSIKDTVINIKIMHNVIITFSRPKNDPSVRRSCENV